MRKLSVLVLLVGLFTSCTQETNIYLDDKRVDVLLNPKTKSTASSRDVYRGEIYVWVKDINVSVEEEATGSVVNETFTLTDNIEDTSEFVLQDIPVGTNIFKANTTTNAESINNHYVNSINDDISIYVDKNPFALYSSGYESLFVSLEASNEIALDMTTQNGRLISHFKLTRNGYQVTVKTYTDGVLTNTSTILNNEVLTSYLSNIDAVEGISRQHILTISRPNSSEVLKTYTIDEVVSASVSKSNTYSIGVDEVLSSSTSLSFTWQAWIEE
jgi:hypothetical protein